MPKLLSTPALSVSEIPVLPALVNNRKRSTRLVESYSFQLPAFGENANYARWGFSGILSIAGRVAGVAIGPHLGALA